jgi:hypothetical protein
MRGALHVALSLMRVPHLALSLFVFPLFLSIVIVVGQIIMTLMLVSASPTSGVKTGASAVPRDDSGIVRLILYGSERARGYLHVCRWVSEESRGDEVPPTSECAPDRLDVALQVSDPSSFDVGPYVELYQGEVDRLHVCKGCRPDAVITVDAGGHPHSSSYSVFGALILALPIIKRANEFREVRDGLRSIVSNVQELMGDFSFFSADFEQGIRWSQLKNDLPLALNISFLIVVSLWLALRAHRRVLDYFGYNHVLLPLVAACGKKRFYSALWWLTSLRVGCFLSAAVPLLYLGFHGNGSGRSNVFHPFHISWLTGTVWVATLIATIGLATVIASIAELQHRDSIMSFLYRYLPIVVAMVGGFVWCGSFLFTGEGSALFRRAITLLPVAGMLPIFVAPVIKVPLWIMVTHGICALGVLVALLRRNARWFAAHLESV